jgi:plasmid stabilization system protein ParE
VTLPVVWLPEADADLRDALAWYRNVRSGLAEDFVLATEAAVEALGKNPQRFPVTLVWNSFSDNDSDATRGTAHAACVF